jgi:hypothetical protein
LGASVILSGLYLFTEAAWSSKVLVGALCLLALLCWFGVLLVPLAGILLQVALCVFVSLYLKANS